MEALPGAGDAVLSSCLTNTDTRGVMCVVLMLCKLLESVCVRAFVCIRANVLLRRKGGRIGIPPALLLIKGVLLLEKW